MALFSNIGKYAGFALPLASHYTLWFSPNAFSQRELLGTSSTIAWLVNLGATSAALIGIAVVLGRKRHLSDLRSATPVATVLSCVLVLALCLLPDEAVTDAVIYALAFLLGVAEAALWILWGEHFARVKAHFSAKHIGAMFGTSVLATTLITEFLPGLASVLFIVTITAASGWTLMAAAKKSTGGYPMLLPKSAAHDGLKNIVVVGSMTFVTSAALYFLVAIIPWEVPPLADQSFPVGIVFGGIVMLLVSAASALSKDKWNILKILPWIGVATIAAFCLLLAGEPFYLPSFMAAAGLSSLVEVLLIMHFGILTAKGYASPAYAFAFSGAFARSGIAVGNTIAIVYEGAPAYHDLLTPPTCPAFIVAVAAVIIPLARHKYSMLTLTAEPPSKAEIEQICEEAAKEYALSARESEILVLITRGHTTNSMAAKLVISPPAPRTRISATSTRRCRSTSGPSSSTT